MGSMFPQLRDTPEFTHKLWDHLAIMANFQLDIDYPYEIIKKENLVTKPEPINYQLTRIHFRHYGRLVENVIAKAADMPEGEEKDTLIALIANHMKKDYVTWNKDTVDEGIIDDDLRGLSDGRIGLSDEIVSIMDYRMATAVVGAGGNNYRTQKSTPQTKKKRK
jgi:hypothetical protein